MPTISKLPSLDTAWAIGEEKYSKILKVLSDREIGYIIEFGSGVSTVRLGQDFPNTSVVSIEHHQKFYGQTMELLNTYQVKNARVLYCPLTWVRVGFLRHYLTYDVHIDQLESGADFVLIDGPVEGETLRGREAPLYMIFPLIKTGALIVLDDYHRQSAKAVVTNWLNSYGKNLGILHEYERIVFLQKRGEQLRPRYPGIHSIWDNYNACRRLGRRSNKLIGLVHRILE